MLLSQWLEKNEVSRAAFASAIGKAPSYVTDICAGRFWPSRDVMMKIVQQTGGEVTANDFLREQV